MWVPERLSLIEAASVPEAFLTAFVNLFREAGLQSDESVLIHGGASGVGTAAIQLAVAAGSRVAVTARDDRKLTTCRGLGARSHLRCHSRHFTLGLTTGNLGAALAERVGYRSRGRQLEWRLDFGLWD